MSFGFAVRGRFEAFQLVPPGGSGSPTGPAGGDLAGTYPDPLVDSVGGVSAAVIAQHVNEGHRYFIQFHHNAGVPGSGVRYLRLGDRVISSETGFRMPAAGALRGITVFVDNASANDYDVEIVSDPTGTPVVLGTLSLSNGLRTASRRDLNAAIGSATEIGARMVRTSGAGSGGPLDDIIVVVELSIQ